MGGPNLPTTERPSPHPPPHESAKAARLRYVTDDAPGIRRFRNGDGFRYVTPRGRSLNDAHQLSRIRSLAIPPAWRNVWICPDPRGHIQATGQDARGRKQYRYHPQWRTVRDETKYNKMLAFARALPRIRGRVQRDLGRPGLPRAKVLAAVVRLLETTFIRVGNEEYARENRSYGLTTLQDKHADIRGETVSFEFRGKSGKVHAITLRDRRLAQIVRHCQALPGQELLQYVDDHGRVRDIDSSDVNEYLQGVAGEEFTAKDFRTWAGTILAASTLQELGHFTNHRQAKRNVAEAVRRVASRLGNTPAVCRKSYIHPEVISAYLDGTLLGALDRPSAWTWRRLRPREAPVVAFLARRAKRTWRVPGQLARLREPVESVVRGILGRVVTRRTPPPA